MPFIGGFRRVGYTQSVRRYPAFIEGLIAFSQHQYGENLALGATSVDLMARDSSDLGTPFPVGVKTRNVVVRIRHNTSGPLGNWTLRLFKNDVEVATFSVGMNG